MTITTGPAGAAQGPTNDTARSAPPGAQRPAAPPNPKQQAVTFALELAKIRATLPGASTTRATDVDQLIADATAIAAFIGQTPTTTSRTFPIGA